MLKFSSPISFPMLTMTRKEALESILALENSFEGSYYDQKLSDEESRKNILDNIAKIYVHRSPSDQQKHQHHHLQYGLRLTTDGFILTSYRHISDVLDEWKKRMPRNFLGRFLYEWKFSNKDYIRLGNEYYPLDVTVCTALPKYDIAILKAMIHEKAKPVKFKVKLKEPEIQDKVVILGETNQNGIVGYEGVVTQNKNVVVHIVDKSIEGVFTIDSKYHLDKGGEPVITPDGKFVGMGVGSNLRITGDHPNKETSAAKVKRIELCLRELTKKLYEEYHLHRDL